MQEAARRQESRRNGPDGRGCLPITLGEVAGAKEIAPVQPMAAEGPSWFGLPALHLRTNKGPPPGANDATTGKEKQLLRPTRPPTNATNAPAKPHAPVPTKNPPPHRMPQSQPPRRCPCTAPTQPPRRLLGRSRPQLSHTRPHSSYRQRGGTSWGLQEQVKQQNDGRRGGTSTSRAPAEPPPWRPSGPPPTPTPASKPHQSPQQLKEASRHAGGAIGGVAGAFSRTSPPPLPALVHMGRSGIFLVLF